MIGIAAVQATLSRCYILEQNILATPHISASSLRKTLPGYDGGSLQAIQFKAYGQPYLAEASRQRYI